MIQNSVLKTAGMGLIAMTLWAQNPARLLEEPDAERTKQELSHLLQRYPPALRGVLALDPNLLSNQAYISPYPALAMFLNAHPEIPRNPRYFVGDYENREFGGNRSPQPGELARDLLRDLGTFLGFGMAIGLLTWLIRTLLDYRRWNRLSAVQTEVHTKLLDRFSANEDLLGYIKSPAGSKFLESAPIALDAGSRSVGAPLGRILWSLQTGLVLAAGGFGLFIASSRVSEDVAQPLHVLGILAISLGTGFALSAGVSFLISHRLGLIESRVKGAEA